MLAQNIIMRLIVVSTGETKLGVAFARWGVVLSVRLHLSGVVGMRAQLGQMTHGVLAPWVGQWL